MSRTPRLLAAAAVGLLLAAASMVYAQRGPAILADLMAAGTRFLCL